MPVFELIAGTFKEGESIPKQHTCEGEDRSPPLRWNHPPDGTRSFVLIADDPDAPGSTWVHWVLFNIPIDVRGLAEGLPLQEVLPNDAHQGMNDFHRVGYGGPCPPPGTPIVTTSRCMRWIVNCPSNRKRPRRRWWRR